MKTIVAGVLVLFFILKQFDMGVQLDVHYQGEGNTIYS